MGSRPAPRRPVARRPSHRVPRADARATRPTSPRSSSASRASGATGLRRRCSPRRSARPSSARSSRCGFTVHEHLHLLRHPLDRSTPIATRPPDRHRASTRAGRDPPGRRRDRDAVLEVDHLAFSPFWRFDRAGLDDARNATPVSRFRVAADGGTVVGYAVTGRAGPDQLPPAAGRRTPTLQRRGVATLARERRPPLGPPPRRPHDAREHPGAEPPAPSRSTSGSASCSKPDGLDVLERDLGAERRAGAREPPRDRDSARLGPSIAGSPSPLARPRRAAGAHAGSPASTAGARSRGRRPTPPCWLPVAVRAGSRPPARSTSASRWPSAAARLQAHRPRSTAEVTTPDRARPHRPGRVAARSLQRQVDRAARHALRSSAARSTSASRSCPSGPPPPYGFTDRAAKASTRSV